MQATVRQLGPRAKATPLRVAWDMTKSALDSHAEDSPAAETGKPLPLGFLVSCIDFRYLLMRLLDRLFSLPILDEYAVQHVANRIGSEHLACGSIGGAGIRELSPALQHDTPMLERWPLPELGVVHALVWRPPASIAFLDGHPQVFWGHPVFGEPFSELWIGIVLEEYQC